MVAILLGADNGFFYAGQIMHFSSPFTVFLIYHKHYKGFVSEDFITSNTFTYFQEAGAHKEKQATTTNKVIKSNTQPLPRNVETSKNHDEYHFVDTLAIIQDVAFKLEAKPAPKLRWWNRLGIWLSKLGRKVK